MVKYIITGIIAVYFIYVIYRRIKDIKNGKFCNCNCENCETKNKCNSLKRL